MFKFLKGRLIIVRICLLVTALILVGIGIATIYSVGHPAESSPATQTEALSKLWKKQVIFAVVAIIGFLIVNTINYRRFGAISYWLYAFILMLLGLLLIGRYVVELPFVPEINGTQRP